MLFDKNTVRGRLARLIVGIIGTAVALLWLPAVQYFLFQPIWVDYGFSRDRNDVYPSYYYERIDWVSAPMIDNIFYDASEAVATRIDWETFIPTVMISFFAAAAVGVVLSYVLEPAFNKSSDDVECSDTGCTCIDHVFCKKKDCTCIEHLHYGWEENDHPSAAVVETDGSLAEQAKPVPTGKDWTPQRAETTP